MKWYERVAAAVGGILLIYPGLVTDVIGIVLVGAVAIIQIIKKKTQKTVLA